MATRRLLAANPRRYGGYLAHVGVVLALVGIAASQSYQVRATATLRPGQTMQVDGYTVRYLGLHPRAEPNRMVLGVDLRVERAGQDLGLLSPSQNIYMTGQQTVVTPAVREEPWGMASGLLQGRSPLPELAQLASGRNPFEDLYVMLEAVDTSNPGGQVVDRSVTIQAMINPMVGFIWLGGFVVGLGGFCALLPARRRRRVAAVAQEAVRIQPEEAPA